MDLEKPPLGLRPKNIWLLERRDEIYQAMQRYLEACQPIPEDWLEQLLEIEKELKKC